MAFPQKYIDYGRITFTNCTVSVYCGSCHSYGLINLPGGKIINAYWQGNHVVVEMESGWVYIYDDFGHISGRYMK